MELVSIARTDGIATVKVEHPPVNAMSDAVIEGLTAVADEIARDPSVAVCVLTGAGERAFLAGADLAELQGLLGDVGEMERHVRLTARMLEAWTSMPQPVIAAVQAHAVGGGLEVALACDLIVADRRARLGLPEVGLGLIPGAGGTQRLPRRVGAATALRMVLMRELVDAERAERIGLVDVVAEAGDAVGAATRLAVEIVVAPRSAVVAATAALRAARVEPLDAGVARERQLFLDQCATPEAAHGVAAFLGRRRGARARAHPGADPVTAK